MTDLNVAELEGRIKSARAQSDIAQEISALRQLGSFYQKSRQLTKAASCLSKALKLVLETGNEEDQAVVRANLGCVYWEMAQLKKAGTHFEEALEIQKRIQHTAGQRRVLTLLGISYWRKCQWEEGLSHFHEVFGSSDTQGAKGANSTEAEPYASLQDAIERGYATLQNRVRLGREQNDPMKILQPLFSMVPLLWFTGRGGEVESVLQEVGSLAEQVQKKDILNMIPKLKALCRGFS